MSIEAVLTVLRAGESPQKFPFQGEMEIGRSDSCAICLRDRAISRQHAVFKSAGNLISIEKKSAFAPLIVNGLECDRAILKEGDEVLVGPYSVQVSYLGTDTKGTPSSSPSVLASVSPSSPPQPIEREQPVASLVEAQMMPEEPVNSLGALEDPLELGAAAEASDGGDASEEIKQDEFQVEPQSVEGSESPDLLDSPMIADEDGKTKITPSSTVIAKLIFKPGDANVEEFLIEQAEVSIGRGKDCDIIITDKKASRKNTLIRRAGMSYSIKDLDSVNGTLLNDSTITTSELTGDDKIQIGDVIFQFKILSADYEAQSANFAPVTPELDPQQMVDESPEDFGSELEGGLSMDGQGGGEPPAFDLNNQFQSEASPVMGNIPGITGVDPSQNKKLSLVDKFKNLPRRTQIILVIVAVVFIWWFLSEDEPSQKIKQVALKKDNVPKASSSATPVDLSFEKLSVDQKRFVETQHSLAFDYYKSQEYDKSLFEVEKIFNIVSDFKDSREIQRYAKEGKRKAEALEEEKKRKEEEVQLKGRIASLVEDTRVKMKAKKYDEAQELFTQILAIDPDNTSVIQWRKELDDLEELKRAETQKKQVQKEINDQGSKEYQLGRAQMKKEKFYAAIATFRKIPLIGVSDRKLLAQAKKLIADSRNAIDGLRDPVLTEAKNAEGSGDFSNAFNLFKKATEIDSHHPEGYAGMNRIRGVLHEKAKSAYTEAILAENYSDFVTAEKMYHSCLDIAPVDDIYHDRAQRKLAKFIKIEPPAPEGVPPPQEGTPPQDGGPALDGSSQGAPAQGSGANSPTSNVENNQPAPVENTTGQSPAGGNP